MAQQAVKLSVPRARKLCRSLLHAMNDAVLILASRSLRILDANESALKIYGYSKEEFIGKELKELTHDVCSYSHLLQKQSIERTDFNKTGGKIDFLVSLSAIDYWGRRAILSINSDIRERKRIEALATAGEKRLRLLIQGISEIVALVDPEGRVLFISPQVERVLGLTVQEVTGRSVFDFVHPDDRERIAAEYARTVQEPGEGIPALARFRNQKSQWVPFEIIASNQLQDPDIAGVIFTARDLRFRLEAETIQQSNAGFDKHIKERTMELAKANAALRIENQQRRYAEIQLKRSLSLHHATLESTADGILVVSNDGFVSGCNQKFMDMWHIPRIDITGRRGADLLLSVAPQIEDPQIFMDGIEALKTKPDFVGCDTLLLKNGRVLERYSQPQRVEEQIVGRVWSFRDI